MMLLIVRGVCVSTSVRITTPSREGLKRESQSGMARDSDQEVVLRGVVLFWRGYVRAQECAFGGLRSTLAIFLDCSPPYLSRQGLSIEPQTHLFDLVP